MSTQKSSGRSSRVQVRSAGPADAAEVGRLLHDFNTEYDDLTPGPEALAARIVELLALDTVVLLARSVSPDGEPTGEHGGEIGDVQGGEHGLAVLRFRPALWARSEECYLAELYVVPDRRGEGIGRILLDAVIATARERGAAWIELGTSEDDVAARALYESVGFVNREHPPDGPLMYVYDLQIWAPDVPENG
jgi:GNAT superfamily N-acetyltransferase